ncbi:MAG: glutathione binding-like protein [Chromatiales bacterium]
MEAQGDAINAGASALREYALLNARLRNNRWLVGETATAADLVLYPLVAILQRALSKQQTAAMDLKLAPFSEHFPALMGWMKNIEALPGYENTCPPHWRE